MQIDKDTLRAALEESVKPLEWNGSEASCDLTCSNYYARESLHKENMGKRRADRILSAIDLDTLAAKLGGGE